MVKQKYLILASLLLLSACAAHKTIVNKPIEYVAKYETESDIAEIYDSLKVPLLIYKNMVFQMHSNCIIKAFDGDANDRNNGGNNNNRNSGANANNRNSNGTNNDRNSNGKTNDRNDGGLSGERKDDGDANDRRNGGKSNNRNNGGKNNDRNAAGEILADRNAAGNIMMYMCEVDKRGRLFIHFKKLEKSESIKIYYNHIFYNNQYFKIKTI